MNAPVISAVSAGIARITLNRPDKRNALDRATVAELQSELRRCANDPRVRVVQITGAGTVFCAGADLSEMQAQAEASEAANLEDARQLSTMLALLDSMPKPTLARVNGDGYGGALGLLAACDIVVAAEDAKFAFTEVRLGIIPAVVSPFVLGKIGASAARRYFLTAETLTAAALKGLGLVHEVVAAAELDLCCTRISEALLKGAPGALAEAKTLISDMTAGATPGSASPGSASPGSAAANRTAASAEGAARLAQLRVQAEAQEGFNAFFAKRKASWRQD